MNRGFLTLAQNGQTDYVRMAYVLAMSLRLSQEKVTKLSVIVNKGDEIPEKYIEWFDKIIYVDKIDTEWKINNKWQFFRLTPYDETIILDSDMLFFNDISLWWKLLSRDDINFTTRVRNYRNEFTTSDYYRKVFTNSKIPNCYTAFFYFKKTKEIEQYFKLVRIIFENWQEFYSKLLKSTPKFLSGDVAFALAAKIQFNYNWSNRSDFLSFIHMRSRLQDDDIVSDWNKELPSFFTNYHGKIELKINNFNQIYPFHYIKKSFLSEEVVDFYEETIRLL